MFHARKSAALKVQRVKNWHKYMSTQNYKSIAELSKLSSQEMQGVVNSMLSENLLTTLSSDSVEAIEKDVAVISAKTELERAKLNAFYNSADCVDDVTAVVGQILRKVVSNLGGSYDNKTDKFKEPKFHAMYSNLWNVAVNDTEYPCKRKDGKKVVVMIRTTAEIASWLTDVTKSYLADKSDAKKRKGNSLSDKIKAYYNGKIEIGKTKEQAILLTCGKFDIEESQLSDYIK